MPRVRGRQRALYEHPRRSRFSIEKNRLLLDTANETRCCRRWSRSLRRCRQRAISHLTSSNGIFAISARISPRKPTISTRTVPSLCDASRDVSAAVAALVHLRDAARLARSCISVAQRALSPTCISSRKAHDRNRAPAPSSRCKDLARDHGPLDDARGAPRRRSLVSRARPPPLPPGLGARRWSSPWRIS